MVPILFDASGSARKGTPSPLSRGAQAFLDATPPDAPPIRDLPLEEARAAIETLMREVDQPGPAMKSVTAASGPAVEGEAPDLRIYEPEGGARGMLVFFHGGGCTLGSLDAYDGFARRLAEATGHVVASVGYPCRPSTNTRRPSGPDCRRLNGHGKNRCGADWRRWPWPATVPAGPWLRRSPCGRAACRMYS